MPGLSRSIGTPLFERDSAAILLEDARSEFQPLGLLRTCQHRFSHLLVAFHVAMSFDDLLEPKDLVDYWPECAFDYALPDIAFPAFTAVGIGKNRDH
jgi:hypothetical protein